MISLIIGLYHFSFNESHKARSNKIFCWRRQEGQIPSQHVDATKIASRGQYTASAGTMGKLHREKICFLKSRSVSTYETALP